MTKIIAAYPLHELDECPTNAAMPNLCWLLQARNLWHHPLDSFMAARLRCKAQICQFAPGSLRVSGDGKQLALFQAFGP